MTQNSNGATPAERICAEEYVVKRGDSFYLIAHKLGVPLRDLLAANRDIHPARLMVGDVLCVPREEDDAPQTLPQSGASGTAGGNRAGNAADGTANQPDATDGAAGGGNATGTGSATSSVPAETDSATETGPATNTTTDKPTADATDTTMPACDESVTVESGQTVADIQLTHLVSRHTLATANPKLNLDALQQGQTVCVPSENVPCALPATYILGAGETLESVAVRFNLPIGSLLRANPCLAPQDFEEGTSIILPK